MANDRDSLRISLVPSRFERHAWRVQRIGWGVGALVLVLGVLGAFGGGVLSRRTMTIPGGRLQLDRVLRSATPGTASWSLTAADSVLAIEVDSAFAMTFTTLHWMPHPARTRATAAGVRHEWAIGAPGPYRLHADATVRGIGRVTVRSRIGEGAWHRTSVFILP